MSFDILYKENICKVNKDILRTLLTWLLPAQIKKKNCSLSFQWKTSYLSHCFSSGAGERANEVNIKKPFSKNAFMLFWTISLFSEPDTTERISRRRTKWKLTS